jgi:predicted GNAT family acetyltransferase
VVAWIEADALHVWEDEGAPVSVAVAQGRTGRGVRIGYVYTPPERRGRGYASALVASLSARMLADGCDFCVLYTDLSNPTSNRIYRRVGYRLLGEVRDYDLESAESEDHGRGT